jgi:hypothetical protein
MLFNVPFIPEPAYVRFLNGIGRHLHSIHFGLEDPALCDARIRVRTFDEETLVDLLKSVSGPRKYLLANGAGGLTNLLRRMERFHTQGVLDGIVFSDAYLLFALSDAAPELAARIEAVPSINFMIDSAQKLDAVLEIIESSRFRPPGKITLDRLLNRRPAALSDLVAAFLIVPVVIFSLFGRHLSARRRAWSLLAIVLVLSLALTGINVAFSHIGNYFTNALVKKNQDLA